MEKLSSYIRRTVDESREAGKGSIRFDVPVTYRDGGIMVLETGVDAVDDRCGRISFTVAVEAHSRLLAPEECIRIGGHCWKYSKEIVVDETVRTINLEDDADNDAEWRTCRHCRQQERKVPYTWEKC